MNVDLEEFRGVCENFYDKNKISNSTEAKDVDAFFIHASPAQRVDLTREQNKVRAEFHQRVENERRRVFEGLCVDTQVRRLPYSTIIDTLKQFIERHYNDNNRNPGIEMFLVALYTLLRLQRCYPRRLAWILDNSAFTENGIDAYSLVVGVLGCEVIDRYKNTGTYVLPATLTNSELSGIARVLPFSVKRSTRILKSLQGDAEAGKKDKMAVGDVYESSSPRDYACKEGILSQLYNYILDIIL
ncbi:hypothetical protein E3P77_02448 [Wallemia ichthyophaga]|nr:hypothetical protein E3P98_00046 [Wallemia ichthyophaga]TIB04291.1 hypothetical protein E3P95_00303 [Wallemia ichthyophaga]TIB05326.1 hypothetical protein E3P94_00303 [Wallemia ichthyophaga]TIB06430.1 hypothetical protein E3P96_00455 [Wallemia ichthyophaga]TIB43992.1 hypothetical protein E3P83_00411 [Wallemia ichthyophaga]